MPASWRLLNLLCPSAGTNCLSYLFKEMTHLEEIRKLYTTRRKQTAGISVSGPNIFFVLFSIYCSVKQQSCISWKRDKDQDRFSVCWLTLQCITCWDETDQSRGPGTQSEPTARLPQAQAPDASLCAGMESWVGTQIQAGNKIQDGASWAES